MAQPTYVPLTREFLKNFYGSHPLDPVPADFESQTSDTEALSRKIAKPRSIVRVTVGLPEVPVRIDDNFWRIRMFCEQSADNLKAIQGQLKNEDEIAACSAMESELRATERAIFTVQEDNRLKVGYYIKKFLPNDFRGSTIESRARANEAKYNEQIENMVKAGCTIREKYDTYLQQQYERREQLADLCNANGIFKFAMTYFAGIPEQLLEFAKSVNLKDGPMEEQRLAYGPDLYKATELGNAVNVLIATFLESLPDGLGESSKVVEHLKVVVSLLCKEATRITQFIGVVFHKSPFFVTPEGTAVASDTPEEPALAAPAAPAPGNPNIIESSIGTVTDGIQQGMQNLWGAFKFSK